MKLIKYFDFGPLLIIALYYFFDERFIYYPCLYNNKSYRLMNKNHKTDRHTGSLEVLLTFYQHHSPFRTNFYSIKNYSFAPKDELIAPWIIEQIREREREKKREQEENQPRVYIDDFPYENPEPKKEEELGYSERGVTIIDIAGDNIE